MNLMFAPQRVTRRGNDLTLRLGSFRFSDAAQTIRYLTLVDCPDVEAALATAAELRRQGDHVAAIEIRLTDQNLWEVALHTDEYGLVFRLYARDLHTADHYAESDL